jgi:Subtilase family/Putative metal-binding motif
MTSRRFRALIVVGAGLFAVAASGDALAQQARWVFLHDKGVPAEALDAALTSQRATFAPRALARRLRTRGGLGLDARDLPVHPAYLAALRATGARIRTASGWLNAVSLEGTPAQLALVARMPFVKQVRPLGHGRRLGAPQGAPQDDPYGASKQHLAMIGAVGLHSCGLTGKGVTVGVLDTGFSLAHKALTGVQVAAKRDFVNKDDVVENEAGDPKGQHDHGTMILSLLAGKETGAFSGAAPDVKVILAKIDDLASDKPIEDDWWVAGLQWAEKQGADLVTTSIGFCTSPCSPAQLDGKTEATSKAAAVAAANGVILVAAAGNMGPKATTVMAPADAVGVIAVGSVDLSGKVAGDSGRGPTYDKRTKPDVMGPGVGVTAVSPNSTTAYTKINGTSVATPLVAGVMALLLQARPGTTAAEMLKLLTSTATKASAPGDTYGWGVVDGLKAAGLHCSCQDQDGDGHFAASCGGKDCDDSNKAVHPGAKELCNGVDDDCDGSKGADEKDADGDGYLKCKDDCDDANKAVNPLASEVCGDGADNDCDGEADPAAICDAGGGDEGGCAVSAATRARLGTLALPLCLVLGLLFARWHRRTVK